MRRSSGLKRKRSLRLCRERNTDMANRLYRFFTSLRLTVALLGLGLILVFWGTLAQVHLGLYKAQNDFFRSFSIYWSPAQSTLRIPIFPGGYLIGWFLLINLFAAHFRYYQPGRKKYGIIMIHLGVVLLLFGQLLTDVLSTESVMHLRNGEMKNYSEVSRRYELAVVDTTDPQTDKVVAIPESRLLRPGEISDTAMPFKIRVAGFYANSSLTETQAMDHTQIQTTAGIGSGCWWRDLPRETDMDKRDIPSGIVELIAPQGTLGSYLVSAFLTQPQKLTYNGHTYELRLRLERFYKPFTVHLLRSEAHTSELQSPC